MPIIWGFIQLSLQVGSFNYDNTKMVYRTYYLPLMPNSTESILDYEVEIASLKVEDTFYLPAETGNYSVAGFEMVLNRWTFAIFKQFSGNILCKWAHRAVNQINDLQMNLGLDLMIAQFAPVSWFVINIGKRQHLAWIQLPLILTFKQRREISFRACCQGGWLKFLSKLIAMGGTRFWDIEFSLSIFYY